MFPWFWNIVNKIVNPKKMTGIIADISKWNYTETKGIDFPALKPQVDGVIIRGSNGAKVDSKFTVNTTGAIKNGIPWGSYHFVDFKEDGKVQAERFASMIASTGSKPELPLVLDTETEEKKLPITGQQLETLCESFLSTLVSKGYDVAIYMSPGFSWFLPKGHKLGKYKLWAADYSGSINPVNGWSKVWMHQYTDKGKLIGIPTAVDLNKLIP